MHVKVTCISVLMDYYVKNVAFIGAKLNFLLNYFYYLYFPGNIHFMLTSTHTMS